MVFALHGLWRRDGALAVWAETPLDAEQLIEVLEGMGPAYGWLAHAAHADTSRLRLPARSGRVQPSPELRGPRWAQEVAGVDPLHLVTVQVPSLVFRPDTAAQLLGELWTAQAVTLACRLTTGVTTDVQVGASLRWLARVHDLAWRTVHRGELLPTIVDGHARWVIAPGSAHWDLARALALAAPPMMRAEEAAPARSIDIVASVVDALVDAEMRLSLLELAPFVRPGRVSASSSPSAVEPWLAALSGPSPKVHASAADVNDLARRLRVWHRSSRAPEQPLRLCLRLVEPLGPDDDDAHGGPSEAWSVELLLQVTAEPSQVIRASDVWKGGLAGVLRLVPDARRLFADELARAAGIFPLLRFALREDRPASLQLTRDDAVEFLRDTAAALTDAGVGVLLPSWWGAGNRLGVSLSARAAQPGTVETRSVLDRDAIVHFAWQAALGETRLTATELNAMAASGQQIMRVRGEWVEVDHEAIAAALKFLTKTPAGVGSVTDLIRRSVDPPNVPTGVHFLGIEAEGWLADLLTGAAAVRVADVAVPGWFTATLRPYQQRGLDWLHLMTRLGLGAVLADDMGLGKTLQTLALLAREKDDGATGPVLVVCPMTLLSNWQRESTRFAPLLKVTVHHGSGRGDSLAAVATSADIVLTTYGLALRDRELLSSIPWRRLVLDEAQNVKNSATQQAKALRSLPAAHRIALTGTPVENRLADLHAVLDQTNPGLFGSALAFKRRYSARIERDGNEEATASLRRLTAPFVLRRQKSDMAIARELPSKQEFTEWCQLSAEQAGLYRGIVDEMMRKLLQRSGFARRGVVLSALTRLKQVCDSPALAIGDGSALGNRSGKLARLEELLTEALAEGDKALCFTQYAALGRPLQAHLSRRLGVEVSFLHGEDSRSVRDRMVTAFQSDTGPPVMLLSLKAGGTGLNLTNANHVIHIDRWWNPAVEDQATDRAFRIGQRKDVQVRKLVCIGTIEERIDTMITTKRALAGSVVGGPDDWLGDLSTDALAELVALSGEAQADE